MDRCLGVSDGMCDRRDQASSGEKIKICDGCGGIWGTHCSCLHKAQNGQAAKLPAGTKRLKPLPSNPKLFFCPLCRSAQLLLESVERAHLGEIIHLITRLRASPFFAPPSLSVYPGLARPGGREGGRGLQRLSALHVAMKTGNFEALLVLASGLSAVPLEVFSMVYTGREGGREGGWEEGKQVNPLRLLPMDPSLRHMALFWTWKAICEECGSTGGREGWRVWWGEQLGEDEDQEDEEEEEEEGVEEEGGGGGRKRARPRRQPRGRRANHSSSSLPPPPTRRDDFTCGSELRKIPWVNEIDSEHPSWDYVYICRSVPAQEVEVLWSKRPEHPCRNSEEGGVEGGDWGCGCLAEDGPHSPSDVVEGCMPHLNGGGRGSAKKAASNRRHGCVYLCHCAELPPLLEREDARGRDGWGKPVPLLVCRNRYETRPRYQLQLYKTERMGWGVKALEAISKSAPVAVYASQVHWNDVVSEYSFIQTAAGGKRSSKVLLESEKFGSIARFFNHRCHGETLRSVSFMSEHSDRVNGGEGIVFVAKRNVRAGEELCFSYAPGAFKEEGCQCDHCVNKTDSSPQSISGKRDRKTKHFY